LVFSKKNCAENEMTNVFVTVMLLMLILNIGTISWNKKSGNVKILCRYLKLYSRSMSSRYVLIFELYKVIETSKIMANSNKSTSVNGLLEFRIIWYRWLLFILVHSVYRCCMLHAPEVYHPEVFWIILKLINVYD